LTPKVSYLTIQKGGKVQQSNEKLNTKEEIKIEEIEHNTQENVNWLTENWKNGVKIPQKMYFDDALKFLHSELHSLDLKQD